MNKRKLTLIVASALGAQALAMGAYHNTVPKTINKIVLSNATNGATNNLTSNTVTVTNVWHYGLFSMTLNNNTLTIKNGGHGTNPYYKHNNAFIVNILNSEGNSIYHKSFSGKTHPYTALYSALNGKTLNNGDVISLTSHSGAHFDFNGKTSTKTASYEVTSNGFLQLTSNLKNLKAMYNGNNTVVTGTTAPNTKVCISIDNMEYETISNSNGLFTYILPSSVSKSSQVTVTPSGYLSQTISIAANENSFKIENSSISLKNHWGKISGKITFDPVTMKLSVSGDANNLGTNSSPFISISTYDTSNSTQLSSFLFNGNTTSRDFISKLNNQSFKFGDVIGINYIPSEGHVYVENGSSSIGNTTGNMEYFQITKNGLVAYSPKTEINPVNVLTTKAVNSATITGISLPNRSVTVTVNGESFNSITSSTGKFTVNVNSSSPLTSNTAINVSVNGTIPMTIYPSSNYGIGASGIYISIGEFGGFQTDLGQFLFNPLTQKIEFLNNGVGYVNSDNASPLSRAPRPKVVNLNSKINPKYSGNIFTITLLNNNNEIINSKTFTGNDTIGDIYNTFNGESFSYGDTIKINYNLFYSKINIINSQGTACPHTTELAAKITKNGFVNATGKPINSPAPVINEHFNAGPGIVTCNWTSNGIDSSQAAFVNTFQINNQMKALVATLTKNCTNDYQKAEAIAKWCDKVPYRVVGGNTIKTFEHGGVCFNKSMLYAVLCRQAGLCVRVVDGFCSAPNDYVGEYGGHAWNQVWIPSENKWITVDTTWGLFDCGNFVNSTRSNFFIQATLWNPNVSYASYFKNDPSKAWYHLGEVWNQGGCNYYNFNYSNDPTLRVLFDNNLNSQIDIYNLHKWPTAKIIFNTTTMKPEVLYSSRALGRNRHKFFTLSLYNRNHEEVFSKSFAGTNNTKDLAQSLKNVRFNYGDTIKVSYNTTEGTVNVLTSGKVIGKATDNAQYFKITKDGLKTTTFNSNEVSPSQAPTNNINSKENISTSTKENINNSTNKKTSTNKVNVETNKNTNSNGLPSWLNSIFGF